MKNARKMQIPTIKGGGIYSSTEKISDFGILSKIHHRASRE